MGTRTTPLVVEGRYIMQAIAHMRDTKGRAEAIEFAVGGLPSLRADQVAALVDGAAHVEGDTESGLRYVRHNT